MVRQGEKSPIDACVDFCIDFAVSVSYSLQLFTTYMHASSLLFFVVNAVLDSLAGTIQTFNPFTFQENGLQRSSIFDGPNAHRSFRHRMLCAEMFFVLIEQLNELAGNTGSTLDFLSVLLALTWMYCLCLDIFAAARYRTGC